ncbi:hypothetical protein Tco_0248555, partial [Tanacetum coccineum]
MSTGVNPTSGASKTVPKRAPRNHSSFRLIYNTSECLDLCAILPMTTMTLETVHVAFDELTEGLTSVQTSSGLAPQQMTSVTNSTELELTALQSVPPTKKQ